ncbi:MAG: VCBS repeat-containing protein, partial [Planctomycetes bacterium]|nr:VCBS repeat-containing protein [Planctomycetota bacterium]
AGIQDTGLLAVEPYVWQFRTAATGGTGTFIETQALGTFQTAVSLGDLDGDGDLDAFFATSANPVWINDGAGTFTDSGQSLGSSFGSGVSLGDLDGDGDLDAFVLNIGANLVLINDGTGTFTNSGQTLGSSFSQGVSLGDLDGDGDLDAFVANDSQANRVWINQGGAQAGTAGTFTDSLQTLGSSGSRGVSLGDVDGDGDLDAFVANRFNQANRVWINQGCC